MTGLMPIYSPVEDWDQGLTCFSCDINLFEVPLDISQIYQSTWHEATHRGRGDNTNITVSFTGNAVYVYHIVANSIPYVNTRTQLSFVLDGEEVGEYNHAPDTSSTIRYNVPVFVGTELAYATHTLVIRGGLKSLLLFDYVVYTADDAGDGVRHSSTLPSTSASTSFGSLSASLPDVPTSMPSFPSTLSHPSTTVSVTSSQNVSSIPSQTSAHSITPTHTRLQTHSPGSAPTTTPSPRRSSHVSTGAIVGATVGSIAAFSLICVLLFCRVRMRNRGRRVHIITLNSGNEPATPVDDAFGKPETNSVLEIKHLSPVWAPLVRIPSGQTSSRSGSSGAAVATVGAYGRSPEHDAGVLREDVLGRRGLGKDIEAIREELARFRAQRSFGRRFRG